MRLSKVKLSGFKSFVDPTTFTLSGKLNGVVGPNGCGKSNIIDAVRWVMGESSAKQLRGESMNDVIFNGATSRKASSFASIELVFDNTEGKLGGQWAAFSELSIKRVLERSGQSSYHLNGARCRRKDITDIFLGTGLGPRSYAIIEQGMISRIVESKPEELRTFFEEAAGISKYKEQKRETELRIEHTRANLLRLLDVREELQKQLSHLEKQAQKAEEYQVLKKEERALTYALLKQQRAKLEKEQAHLQEEVSLVETEFKAMVEAYNTHVILLIDDKKVLEEKEIALTECNESYHLQNTELINLRHNIESLNAMKARDDKDYQEITAKCTQISEALTADNEALITLSARKLEEELSVQIVNDELPELTERVDKIAQLINNDRTKKETIIHEINQLERKADSYKSSIAHYEAKAISDEYQLIKIKEDYAILANLNEQSEEADLIEAGETLTYTLNLLTEEKNQLDQDKMRLTAQLQQSLDKSHQLMRIRAEHEGRLSALLTLQNTLVNKESKPILSPLYESLTVTSDWENALESVLSRWLTLSTQKNEGGFHLGEITYPFTENHLGFYVQSDQKLGSLLAHVFIADDALSAKNQQPSLQLHEWIVLKNGNLYGKDWFIPYQETQENRVEGVLERTKTINSLKESLAIIEEEQADLTILIEEEKQRVSESTQKETELTLMIQSQQQQLFANEKSLSLFQKEHEHRTQNSERIEREQLALKTAGTEHQQLISEAQSALLQTLRALDEKRAAEQLLIKESTTNEEVHHTINQQKSALQNRSIELMRVLEATKNQEIMLVASIKRLTNEEAHLKTKHLQSNSLDHYREALEEAHQQLALKETKLRTIEVHKNELYQTVIKYKKMIGEHETLKTKQEQERAQMRERIQMLTIKETEFKAHFTHLENRWQAILEELSLGEQLEINQEIIELSPSDFESLLKSVRSRLERIGAVNLIAIDECKEFRARRVYLDDQDTDLNQAILALESAIKRIDGETRERFMDTFNKVNSDFSKLFPHLFGGGEGYLEILGEDALTSGVNIIARPPGKKPGTIHLLSGGEKALTAMALVFGIFNLNPAPFCMLDEVDAPLDEANVRRLGDLLNEMSKKVQFIFITHNKATMAIADSLIGVTMSEPGVSRLVSVDLEKAAQFSESLSTQSRNVPF